MRDIASAVGINVASIYNHYGSKEAILHSLYETYEKCLNEARPDMDSVMRMCETASVAEIMAVLDFHYKEDQQEMIDRTILTATRMLISDPLSVAFVKKCIFDNIRDLLVAPMNRMIELGRIEPIDVDAFVILVSHFSFSAAMLNFSPLRLNLSEWHAGLSFILPRIKEGDK
ncbi:hypothetical protein FACS18948_6750 [Clostridia bacterium]|nr:hypothetical protein FACS18948_6750 [Clostridia bacterium]